jgi:hypothetical protein
MKSPVVPSEANVLSSLTVVSPRNIWAVGWRYSKSLIEQWDGTGWKVVDSPSPGIYSSNLNSVTAVGPKNVWAAGYAYNHGNNEGIILQWDGTAWKTKYSSTLGSDDLLLGISALAEDNIWAVGHTVRDKHYYPVMLHWDRGHQWTRDDDPTFNREDYALSAVAAVGKQYVWTIGRSLKESEFRPLVARFSPPCDLTPRFDVVTITDADSRPGPCKPVYDNEGRQKQFCDVQFDALNWYPKGGHGHYLAMPTFNKIKAIHDHDNELAASTSFGEGEHKWKYDINSKKISPDHTNAALSIAKPWLDGDHKPLVTWMVLDEITFSAWHDKNDLGTKYRRWVIDVVTDLHNMGFKVLVLSPIVKPQPGTDAGYDDWKNFKNIAYIGIEGYLDSRVIYCSFLLDTRDLCASDTIKVKRPEERGKSESQKRVDAVAWAQGEYKESLQSFVNAGLDWNQLFLMEHFAHTKITEDKYSNPGPTGYIISHGTASKPRGRMEATDSEWTAIINIRSEAIANLRVSGFVSFGWHFNEMQASLQKEVGFEKDYSKNDLHLLAIDH